MAWFNREKPGVDEDSGEGEKRLRTEGLWLKCESCGQIIWKKALDENFQCCPKCEFHFRVDARTRLGMLFDSGFEEFDTGMTSCDPLHLDDAYLAKLATARENDPVIRRGAIGLRRARRPSREHLRDGVEVHRRQHGRRGRRENHPRDRTLPGGNSTPLIIVSASGGARMQEGTFSLMQLAKISAALMRLDEARVPYISVLTDPTTGGVTASFAMLGDLNIAEPGR